MKKIFFASVLVVSLNSFICATPIAPIFEITAVKSGKLDIKIKNDSGDDVTVYNAGSGGSYRLAKNVTTTIKMDAGDKLYIYDSGKKGKLVLTADASMDGKVQLFSKL